MATHAQLKNQTQACHSDGCKNPPLFIVHLGPKHDERLCEEHKVARVTPIVMAMFEQDKEFRELVESNEVDYHTGTNWPQYPRWNPI